MPTVQEIQILKAEVEQLKDKLSRTKGTIEQLRKQHKDGDGSKSLNETLASLEATQKKLQQEYSKLLIAFNDKHEGELSGYSDR